MANRITDKDLQAVVDRINRTLKQPMKPYEQIDGKLVEQIGNYHLDSAYGGVKLSRMASEGGGIEDVLSCGFTTKRELYELMHAFLRGYEASEVKP